MKKLTTVLSMLLAFVMAFQTTAFAAEDIGNAVSSGSGSAQESALAEDDFVLITGGTFQMGSPASELERSSDETRHSVAVGNRAYPLRLPRCPACRCGARIGIRLVQNAGMADGEAKSVYGARAEQKTGKTLIVYFSQTGNTEGLADLIHEMSGADIFRLERKTPYSSSSNGPVLYEPRKNAAGKTVDEAENSNDEATPGEETGEHNILIAYFTRLDNTDGGIDMIIQG